MAEIDTEMASFGAANIVVDRTQNDDGLWNYFNFLPLSTIDPRHLSGEAEELIADRKLLGPA